MGNTPGVVEEPIEPIDEPMKEGISPMGAAGKVLVGCCKVVFGWKSYLGHPWYQRVVE